MYTFKRKIFFTALAFWLSATEAVIISPSMNGSYEALQPNPKPFHHSATPTGSDSSNGFSLPPNPIMTNCQLQLECATPVGQETDTISKDLHLTESRIRVPIRSARGPPGPVGPQGIRGMQGLPGPMGPRGPPGECTEKRKDNKSHKITEQKTEQIMGQKRRRFERNKRLARNSDITHVGPGVKRKQIRQPLVAQLPIVHQSASVRMRGSISGLANEFESGIHQPRTAGDDYPVILKEILLPEKIRFTDRLVTLEDSLGHCTLKLSEIEVTASNLYPAAKQCNLIPVENISPLDGIVIDWSQLDGISEDQFWKLFEKALINDTFTVPIKGSLLENYSGVASVSWRSLIADEKPSEKWTGASYAGGALGNREGVRYLQRQTKQMKMTKQKNASGTVRQNHDLLTWILYFNIILCYHTFTLSF